VHLLTSQSHVKVYEGEHNGFIYCCVAIWAFDRFMRLARTINLGLIPRFFKGIKATATYDDAADIIRLDVTDLLSPKTITPGHYYYLYAPGDIQGYQSHPFTLCSWRRAIGSSTQNSPITTATEDDKHSQPTTRSSSSSSSSSSDVVHSLLIRPYRGFTGRLQKKLSKSPDPTTSTQLTVFLEGPYGNALDLRSFSDVLIIVGGSGITAAISHSNFLLPTQQTSVHVVWAVQHSHLVDNICENELKEALNDAKLDLVVYETRKASADVEKMAPSKASRPVIHGRPDIGAVIREAREKCGRNLAVVTCGPPRMADACRAAVVDVLGEKGPGVEFYNEALGW
jgi:NAD(P)H-flavin reductase